MMAELREATNETATFTHILDLYDQGKEDREWIPQCASEGGWVIISGDRAKNNNAGGKLPALCREQGVTHIILGARAHQLRVAEKLSLFQLMWPQIAEARNAKPGTRFKLQFKQLPKNRGLQAVLINVDESEAPTLHQRRKKKTKKRGKP